MSTRVGAASFDLTSNNSQALRAIQQVAEAARKQLADLKVTPTVQLAGVQAALKQQLAGVQAQVAITLKPITQAQVDVALGKVKEEKTVKIGVALDVKGDLEQRIAEIKAKLGELRSSTQEFLKVDVSSVERVITLLKQQVAELNRVESALRTLRLGSAGSGGSGGGTGGGSPGSTANPYLAQLKGWQTELKAGTATTAEFDAGLRTLQATLQTDIAALRSLGTLTQADAAQMNQMKAALAGVNAEINKNDITKLRSDLAGARTAFEQAIGAAGRFNFLGQRAATQAYEAELARLVGQIRAVGTQAGTTQAQLRGLNQLSAQIASQRNAINGVFSQVGLAGNITNALKSLPQFAAQMGGSLGAAFAGTQQLTGGLEALAGAAGPVGVALGIVVAALAALTLGLGRAVGTAGDFQQTMVDLKALTQPTTEQFQQLNQTALTIGLSMDVGPREAAKALLELNKAGLPTQDILNGGAQAALSLAGAAGITADQAAKLAVAAQTAFGIAGRDMPKIADVFANFANKTFLGAEDLQQAMAAVGPVAKDAGLSIEQFAGYMASLAQGGFKNMADAGTSMKTLLTSLQAPSDTAAGALKKLKVSFYDAAGASRPLGEVLEEVRQKLAGLTDEKRNKAIQDIFGSDAGRAARVFFSTTNAAIEENIRAMGLQGEAARVARERNESFQGQVRILRANFEQLTITLGEKFLPALTSIVKGLNGFLNEVQRGGPIIQELKGYVIDLAAAFLFLKGGAIASSVATLIARLGGIGPLLGAASSAVVTFGGRLASAASAGMAFGGVSGALSGVAAVLRTVTIGAAAAVSGLTVAVTAAAALAAISNKIMADTARAYDQADQGNSDRTTRVMARITALRKEGTELAAAQAKVLVAQERLAQAQEGQVVGAKWTGERIIKVDDSQVKAANEELKRQQQNLILVRTETERHAAAAKSSQGQVQAALKLTDDQLKKQASTVKDLREALGKPVKLFGGTEFQGQLAQIAEQYRQLRDKLREDVLDPKLRNQLSRQLTARQEQEQTQARLEYGSRASDAAASEERKAQQARVSAMAEGSAKIRAQARLDADEVRRSVAEQAKTWRDFPEQVARIRQAGANQIAQIEAEANRKALEADQKAAKARLAEAKRQQAEVQKVAELGRQFSNLNANFGLQLSQGKAAPESLQRYQQAVAGLRAEIERLPQGQQGRFAALLGQAGQLDQQGQALVALKGKISEVRDRVKDMTVAELEAARARWAGVPAAQALVKAIDLELPKQRATEYKASLSSLTAALADMTDAELQSRLANEKSTDTQGKRVAAIQKEIAARQKLRDATLLQGRLEYQRNDAQAVIDSYESRKALAQGDAAELLRIEQQSGAEVLAARQRLAQVDAEQSIIQAREKFGKLIQDAQAHGQSTVELERQQAEAIQQIRNHRDEVQRQNKATSDALLIKTTQDTTAELVRLANERADQMDAVENQGSSSTVSRYDLRTAQATSGGREDLQERLRVEQQMGEEVVLARQDMAQRAADSEIRAQTEKYRVLKQNAKDDVGEQQRLQTELDQWIVDRGKLLTTEQERIYFEGAQARIAAERAVADAILQMHRDLTDALNQREQAETARRQQQAESDLQQELRAAGSNEALKLQILQREQGRREQLAREGVEARMKAEREAEERRWADLKKSSQWTAADAKLREQMERDHQDRLTEIATQGEFDKGQAVLQVRNQTEDQAQRVQEKRAQDLVKPLTRNLNDMTVAQRQQSETTLRNWLSTFQTMGVAGQAAAKVIQEALDTVANANADAQERAVDLADKLFPKGEDGRFANAETVARTLASRTAAIGKPDSRSDAVAKAEGGYASEIEALKKGITDAQAVIDTLGSLPADKLNAEQALALRMAQTYKPLFEAQLPKTLAAATSAVQKAGDAFMASLNAELTKAQDSAADAALQLAEANLKLASSKRLDGTRDYNTALAAYRDYWQSRMGVLQKGLADAQAAETAARAKLQAVSSDPAATDDQRAAAQAGLTTAITNTATAQAALNQATTNYVTGQERVLDSTMRSKEALEATRGAQDQLDGLLGRTRVAYDSQIKALDDLIKKYPEQAGALGQVRAEYERIQAIRQSGTFADKFRLDFQIGFNGGEKKLSDTLSSVAQGFGELANPMSLLATVIEKINVVGTVLEGIMSAIEEPVKALQEPFRLIGEILGSLIAANLQLLAPILQLVVNIFAALYDALAEFVYRITFGFYDIRRKDPNDSPSGRRELATQKGENDQTQLDLDYRKGLISREQYETEKLRLLKEGLDRQEAAEIEAANGNQAKIAEIRRKYALKYQSDSLDTQERIQQGALDDIDEQVKRGLLSEKEAAKKKYELQVEYLNRQRREALAAANGDQDKILQINKKYDGLILDAKLDMLEKLSAAYKQIGETLMDSITSSVKDGLLGALKAGNFGAFRTQFRQNMRQAMFDAVLSAAIETAALKGILQPAIDALTAALQTPDEADDNAAIQGLLKAGSKVEGVVARIYGKLKPLRDAWGIKDDQGGNQSMTVTGKIDTPEVRVSLDALAMLADVIQNRIPAYADVVNLHIPALQADALALNTQMPVFSTAIDQFGLHEAAYQQSVAQFGGHVGAFGGYVGEFGQHVRVLAGAANAARSPAGNSGNGAYVPTPKR